MMPLVMSMTRLVYGLARFSALKMRICSLKAPIKVSCVSASHLMYWGSHWEPTGVRAQSAASSFPLEELNLVLMPWKFIGYSRSLFCCFGVSSAKPSRDLIKSFGTMWSAATLVGVVRILPVVGSTVFPGCCDHLRS